MQGDVLSEEEGPVASGGARQAFPRWVLDSLGVPIEGGHGERRMPDEEASSGAAASDEELELDDEEDVGGVRR